MTRQIDEIMATRFFNGEKSTLSNTRVENKTMWLFGNKIAWLENGILNFTMCGWNTVTTRNRLRGLGIDIKLKNGKPYYNNKEIDKNSLYQAI